MKRLLLHNTVYIKGTWDDTTCTDGVRLDVRSIKCAASVHIPGGVLTLLQIHFHSMRYKRQIMVCLSFYSKYRNGMWRVIRKRVFRTYMHSVAQDQSTYKRNLS